MPMRPALTLAGMRALLSARAIAERRWRKVGEAAALPARGRWSRRGIGGKSGGRGLATQVDWTDGHLAARCKKRGRSRRPRSPITHAGSFPLRLSAAKAKCTGPLSDFLHPLPFAGRVLYRTRASPPPARFLDTILFLPAAPSPHHVLSRRSRFHQL
ncbi:hypothetical protein B0J12DRAFT_388260 [Macrophomina phaseolina]|uniref:Uncharacterized protein n=1 Tax=Macrophomina phaseolina TaxID=35725 RepID=A0ABQ8FSM3_9PEZI|nr:hypothetical protein B0J12DRAFT_388260 [Macrophomina phaseolina]